MCPQDEVTPIIDDTQARFDSLINNVDVVRGLIEILLAN